MPAVQVIDPSKPIKISEVTTSCGCLTGGPQSKEIQPKTDNVTPEFFYFEAKPSKAGAYKANIRFYLEGHKDQPIRFEISGTALDRFVLDRDEYTVEDPVPSLK